MPALTHILQSLTEDDYPGIGRYVWRPEGGRREWSQGLIRLYGRIEAPRCEAEFMACVHPDDRLRVEGETEAFLTGDANSYTRSFRIVRPDRSVRYVIDRARIERDAQGCVTGIFGLNMDVTDLPEMTKSGVDAETEIVGGRADDMSRVLPDRERFDFGQRTSGLALADIDYQAGTVSLDAVGAQLYGFGKGPVTVSRDEIHVRFHPDDRERLAKEISLSLDPSDGGTLDTEHRIVLPDGTQRWLRVQKRIDFATADRKRRPDRGILAALDITERKESELRLRNSEERLLLAQKAAGIGVWDVDLENKQTVWSEGLYDLMQIERGTPPSPDLFFKYVHPDDEPGLRDAFNCAIRDVSSFKSDFRVVLPDGTLRYFVGQGTVTSEHEGYARRIVGVNYDVTDLKTAEVRLRESEAQLRLILDETAGIVGILDVDGTLREANRAALEAGDITREDVIGMPLWDASWWLHDPDEVARVKDAVARAAAGETVRYDAQIAAGGGRLRTIDFNLSPVRNANGEVTLLVPSALDITERKQAETRLARIIREGLVRIA